MIIKGDKESIKRYLIKNKNEVNILDFKLGGETRLSEFSDKIIEKETEVRIVSKEVKEPHNELSLRIFKAFGI